MQMLRVSSRNDEDLWCIGGKHNPAGQPDVYSGIGTVEYGFVASILRSNYRCTQLTMCSLRSGLREHLGDHGGLCGIITFSPRPCRRSRCGSNSSGGGFALSVNSATMGYDTYAAGFWGTFASTHSFFMDGLEGVLVLVYGFLFLRPNQVGL